MKIAGRDAGKKCVVIEINDNMALVDGQTRRRKCNLKHLEPLNEVLKIKKGASTTEVIEAFKTLKIDIIKTTPKPKKEKPKKQQKVKEPKAVKKVKADKKPAKKTVKKVESKTVEEKPQSETVKEAVADKPVKKAVKKTTKKTVKKE